MANNNLLDFLNMQGDMIRTHQAIAQMPLCFLKSCLLVIEQSEEVLRDRGRTLDEKKLAADLLCKSVRVYRGSVNELNPKTPNVKLNLRDFLTKGTQFIKRKSEQTLASFLKVLESVNVVGRLRRCSRQMEDYCAELSTFLPQGVLLPGPRRLRARVGVLNVRLATITARLMARNREARLCSEELVKKETECAKLKDENTNLRQQLSGVAPFVPHTSPVVTKCSCGSEIEQLEERCRILEEQKESLENNLRELGNKLQECERVVRVQEKECVDVLDREWNALVKFEALKENFAQMEDEFCQAKERLAELENRDQPVSVARREVPTTVSRYRATDAETDVSDVFDTIAAENVAQDRPAVATQSRKRKADSPTGNDQEFGSHTQRSKKKKAKVDEEYEDEMSGLELPQQLDMYIDGDGIGANFDGVSMDNFEQQPMGDEQQGGPEVIAEMDKMVEDFMAQQRVDRPDAVSAEDPVQTVVLEEEAQNQQVVEREGEAAAASGQTQLEIVADKEHQPFVPGGEHTQLRVGESDMGQVVNLAEAVSAAVQDKRLERCVGEEEQENQIEAATTTVQTDMELVDGDNQPDQQLFAGPVANDQGDVITDTPNIEPMDQEDSAANKDQITNEQSLSETERAEENQQFSDTTGTSELVHNRVDEQNARAVGSDPIPLPQDRDVGSLVQMGLDTPKEMDTSDTPRNFIEELFGAGGIAQSAGRIDTVAAEIGQRPNPVDIAKRRQLSITPPRPAEDTDTVNNNTYPQTALPTVAAAVQVQPDEDVKDQVTETDGEGEGKLSSQGSSSSNGTSSGATYFSCRSSQSVEEKDLSAEGDAMIEESQVVDGSGINGNEGDDETRGLEKEGDKIADAVKVVEDPTEADQMETGEENAGQDVMHPGPGGNAERDPAVSGDEQEEMDTSESSSSAAPRRSSWLNPFSWFRRSGSQ